MLSQLVVPLGQQQAVNVGAVLGYGLFGALVGAAIFSLIGAFFVKGAISFTQKIRGSDAIVEGGYGKAYGTVFIASFLSGLISVVLLAILALTGNFNPEQPTAAQQGLNLVSSVFGLAFLAYFVKSRHNADNWGTAAMAVLFYILLAIAIVLLIGVVLFGVSLVM